MTNFIFKSQGLIKNVDNKLTMILSELRHQRSDNTQILYLLNKLIVDKNLQTQVDDYFEKDPFGSAFKASLDETPPQTDSDEQ